MAVVFPSTRRWLRKPLAGRFASRKVFEMRTFVIEGKPLEEVTIKVKGQSLTLTEGVEVTVIVVVASQQPPAPDAGESAAQQALFTPEAGSAAGKLPTPTPRR